MANYKSNRDYKSKEELLELISLKIVEEDGKFYLMDFDEIFKQRIYSKSFTNIKRGLDNLKKINCIIIQWNQNFLIRLFIIYNIKSVVGVENHFCLKIMRINIVLVFVKIMQKSIRIERINEDKGKIQIIMKKELEQ